MIILVTGMMRTGTSLVSKALHQMGVPMGTRMRFPLMHEHSQEDWEDIAFTDMVLDEFRFGGLDLPTRIAAYEEDRQGPEVWGVKSPFALPYIREFKNATQDEVRVVLCTRYFADAYESLRRQTSDPSIERLQDRLRAALDTAEFDLAIDHSEHFDSPDAVKAKLLNLTRS